MIDLKTEKPFILYFAWEVYFKYTLSMLNLYFDPWSKKKYDLTEISKQKYKWSMKTEKIQNILCLYFNDISLILLDFCRNEAYFKYTFDFKTKCLNFGNLTQIYFWVRTLIYQFGKSLSSIREL